MQPEASTRLLHYAPIVCDITRRMMLQFPFPHNISFKHGKRSLRGSARLSWISSTNA